MTQRNDDGGSTGVLFGDDAQKRLYKGLQMAAEAVISTMGPQGKTVLIQNSSGLPTITKDGVSVSEAIYLKDPVERMGAQLICEAASRTNSVAGDGTTTATLLTYSIVTEGLKLMAAGHSSVDLKKGIDEASKIVIKSLKKIAKQITTQEELVQIATISANGDAQIGNLISTAIQTVGRDGVVMVADAKGFSTSLEVVDGMQLDAGYLSPYFATNSEKLVAEYDDTLILLVDGKINTFEELIPALTHVNQTKSSILIVAEDFDGEVLKGLLANRTREDLRLKVVAIKAPGHGAVRSNYIQDMAVLSGAKVISPQMGTSLSKFQVSFLGKCDKITVDRHSTNLVGKPSQKTAIEEYVKTLREQIVSDITLNEQERSILRTRIARLSSGVAIIRVGGSTEMELKERKYRIEDALNATRAAVEEGIVPGGGSALIRAAQITDFKNNTDKQYGYEIIQRACSAPLRQIVKNCGLSEEVALQKVLEKYAEYDGVDISQIPSFGFDIESQKCVDMFEKGITDPVKVTRSALENAASAAGTILSLNSIIFFEGGQ